MEDAIERGMAELRGLEGSGPGGEKEQRVTPGEIVGQYIELK